MTSPLTFDHIRAAAKLLAGVAYRTPVRLSEGLSRETGAQVYLKLENLQRTGSFKIRGAYHRISKLTDAERRRGIVAAGAGNHAMAVALSALKLGTTATVVMPRETPIGKVRGAEEYGAKIVLEGESFDDAFEVARATAEHEGRTFIHPFDDYDVMAGQGTIGIEILEDVPDVDIVVVPVGGGGLLAGIAVAVHAERPGALLFGVQAAGAASLPRALKTGRVEPLDRAATIAEGIATKRVGEKTFAILREHLAGAATVSDEEIAAGIHHLLESRKVLAEGAGAAPLAAILARKIPGLKDRKVMVVISGGNLDVNWVPHIVHRGMVREGRYLKLQIVVPDRVGTLRGLLDVVAAERGNVLRVHQDRTDRRLTTGEVRVDLDLETRDAAHLKQIVAALDRAGYLAQVVD